MDILFAVVLILVSSAAAYLISNAFWKSVHAKTDKYGDAGAPRGATLSSGSGMIISLVLSAYVFKHLIASADVLSNATLASIVVSTVAGLVPLFRRR